MYNTGQLYICGTPLGNLDDITLRVLKTLKNVDLIAAEDTRRTRKLLNHFEIDMPLTSYHEHNEREKSEELLDLILQGKNIALVSDAGMPGISDPGLVIIKEAIKAGVEVVPVPGPTAAISALVVSGLDMRRFVFEGFLPRKGRERKERLEEIKNEKRTIILYESPYRIKSTLKELAKILKDREVALIREISKVYEEKYYGTCQEVLDKIGDKELKGEMVLVIAGRPQLKAEKEGWEDLSIIEHVKLLMEGGMTKKKAIKKVAKIRQLPKREVYKKAISIKVDNNTRV